MYIYTHIYVYIHIHIHISVYRRVHFHMYMRQHTIWHANPSSRMPTLVLDEDSHMCMHTQLSQITHVNESNHMYVYL